MATETLQNANGKPFVSRQRHTNGAVSTPNPWHLNLSLHCVLICLLILPVGPVAWRGGRPVPLRHPNKDGHPGGGGGHKGSVCNCIATVQMVLPAVCTHWFEFSKEFRNCAILTPRPWYLNPSLHCALIYSSCIRPSCWDFEGALWLHKCLAGMSFPRNLPRCSIGILLPCTLSM